MYAERMEEMRKVYEILTGKGEGKTIPYRFNRLQVANDTETDHECVQSEDVDWIKLAQGWLQWRAIVNRAVNVQILCSVQLLPAVLNFA